MPMVPELHCDQHMFFYCWILIGFDFCLSFLLGWDFPQEIQYYSFVCTVYNVIFKFIFKVTYKKNIGLFYNF